jgi:hypothetical protein
MRPALYAQGQGTAVIGQMHQGLATLRATGDELRRPQYEALAAEQGYHAAACVYESRVD